MSPQPRAKKEFFSGHDPGGGGAIGLARSTIARRKFREFPQFAHSTNVVLSKPQLGRRGRQALEGAPGGHRQGARAASCTTTASGTSVTSGLRAECPLVSTYGQGRCHRGVGGPGAVDTARYVSPFGPARA